MSRRATAVRVCGVALALAGLSASPAAAEYTRPEALSASSRALANGESGSLSVSADGRYAVLATSATTLYAEPDPPGTSRLGGVFRRAIGSGEPELVVPGTVISADAGGSLATAGGPAISGDGRFVAFSTTLRLTPGDTNTQPDVYVRDMTKAAGLPGAYTLASAPEGSQDALTYADPDQGSLVYPGGLSEDGRRVAFLVLPASDVAGPDTPARQVVVRDLDRGSTTLVTRRADGQPVQPTPAREEPFLVRLSGDGTTVIWSGLDLSQLVAVPIDVNGSPGERSGQDTVTHLLWRRVGDAASATRLVTGESDPDDPACPADGALTGELQAATPCDGPFLSPQVASASISRDGNLVAVVAGPPRTASTAPGANDAYLIDMAPGLTRKAAVVERLTQGPSAGEAGASAVSMSPDTAWIAYASDAPPGLAPPTPLGTFPIARRPGIYVFDRGAATVEFVSPAIEGLLPGERQPGSGLPSIADGGRAVAFIAYDANLFYGDANNVPDAAAVRRVVRDDRPGPVALPAPAPAPAVGPAWRMAVTALSRADGTVSLSAILPAGGTLAATPRLVPWSSGARRGRTRARVGAPVKAEAKAPGLVRVLLRPAAGRWARAARSRDGLRARVTVTFRAPAGGPALTQDVSVRFKRRAAKRGGR